jgi:aminopeptidase-like protein
MPQPSKGAQRSTEPPEHFALPAGEAFGAELYQLTERLYPICRSLTGSGVRETLQLLEREADLQLEITEVPTGTQIYDWTVPQEWVIRDAYVADPSGTRVIDFADSNLHVVGYSEAVRRRVTLAELDAHLHSLPDQPSLVPYRTAYYADTWGFCVADDVRRGLADVEYDVVIDAERIDGSLTIAEARVPGRSEREVLLSCNTCHPSLANDGVSGIALTALLAREVARQQPRLTYRFLFSPGTLGPLAWLAQNEATLERIQHGLVVSCVGDAGGLTYKRTRDGNAATDRITCTVLADLGADHRIDDFVPWGGDERQFCSPGFNLPVGCLSRTPHGEYSEYHSSADNLDLVSGEALTASWDAYRATLAGFDGNVTYESANKCGEPQLGRRGLYRQISTGLPADSECLERARLWVLNLADGRHDVFDIAQRAELHWELIAYAARELHDIGLLHVRD